MDPKWTHTVTWVTHPEKRFMDAMLDTHISSGSPGTPVPRPPRLALVKTNASDAPQSGLEETVQSVHSVRLAQDVHIVKEREHVFPVLQLPSEMFQRALYPD